MNTLVLVLRHSIENSSNHRTEMVEYNDLSMLQCALSDLPFACVSKRILPQNCSHEHGLDLHENEDAGEKHFDNS